MGSKGIDLPKIVQKLELISTKRTFEPIEPVDDLDIENLLQNEIRNKILVAFDSGYNEVPFLYNLFHIIINSIFLDAQIHL